MIPELAAIPLFAELTTSQIELLIARSERRELPAGHVLFETGSTPDAFCLLTQGSVSIRDEDGEQFLVKASAAVGELGVLTGEPRRLTAVTAEPSTVYSIAEQTLRELLEQNGELGFGLLRGMLKLSGRKIARDQRRLREMRENIVSTQKAMKLMQESLLEGEDSPLHAALFEEMDALVERNKRAHYLVEPSRLVPTQVRVEGAAPTWVKAISNEWLYFERPAAPVPAAGQDWAGVLVLDGRELLVSGTVEKITATEVVIYLNPLVAQDEAQLHDHLARARMLDVVL